ncbi:protein of unknown function [Clostridium beijerinckii]|nr:protein of unknown function [Clostridium beijerinckii]
MVIILATRGFVYDKTFEIKKNSIGSFNNIKYKYIFWMYKH